LAMVGRPTHPEAWSTVLEDRGCDGQMRVTSPRSISEVGVSPASQSFLGKWHDVPMSEALPSPGFRVTRVVYRLKSESDAHDFSKAAPLDGHLDGWSFRLEDGVLSATPHDDCRTREAARNNLEDRLREWSQSVFLSGSGIQIRFDYERSEVEVIDPPPNAAFVFPETAMGTLTAGTPTIRLGHGTYPAPDPAYRRTPLTDLLTERLRALEDGRAELPAVAYLVLSAIEQAFGGRKACAAALSVDSDVLGTLGRLSAQFDPVIGRKAFGDPKPLTGDELGWLRAVSPRLVRRLGEAAAGGPLAQVTMADLPKLPPAAG